MSGLAMWAFWFSGFAIGFGMRGMLAVAYERRRAQQEKAR